MLDWVAIHSEYEQLTQKLINPNLDPRERVKLQKRAARFSELLGSYEKLKICDATVEDCKKNLALEQNAEMRELYQEELSVAQSGMDALNKEIEEMLYPRDDRDERDVFLEIRAGAGGQEAALFAGDLLRMYTLYALSKGWHVSLVEEAITDLGGYSKVVAHITGKDVFKFFKFESGVHRVQRVPKTEGAGRIHTSTVTVAVMPEADDVEVTINPSELRIDVYRSSGAGGQHVNTTDSAVRITHIPTGLVVTCQDERSQIKNKAKAMKELQARLFQAELDRQEAEQSAQRKQQIGSGDRAEKIRTYNYPQNRITDHRIELTLKKLDIIMDSGDLDELIVPMFTWDAEQRRARGSFLDQID
ncbi:peptide chain release factor 1 [Candidatus Dependentiae bacterium]|nr:peptide chain release factor 1 [Candidatus Dependentiae bacterium]